MKKSWGKLQAKATGFASACRSRLSGHLRARSEENRLHHFAYHWSLQNAIQVGGILGALGLLREDVATIKNNRLCLLKAMQPGTEAFILCSTNRPGTLQGAYLFWDKIDMQFVRSGKAVGQSFADRYKQHESASKQGTSNFYRAYPHSFINLCWRIP